MPIEMCGKRSGDSNVDSLEIEGTGCTGAGSIKDMEVDHGRFDGGVAEERLEGSDIGAALEEVGGEGVTKCMTGDSLWDVGSACGVFDEAL